MNDDYCIDDFLNDKKDVLMPSVNIVNLFKNLLNVSHIEEFSGDRLRDLKSRYYGVTSMTSTHAKNMCTTLHLINEMAKSLNIKNYTPSLLNVGMTSSPSGRAKYYFVFNAPKSEFSPLNSKQKSVDLTRVAMVEGDNDMFKKFLNMKKKLKLSTRASKIYTNTLSDTILCLNLSKKHQS